MSVNGSSELSAARQSKIEQYSPVYIVDGKSKKQQSRASSFLSQAWSISGLHFYLLWHVIRQRRNGYLTVAIPFCVFCILLSLGVYFVDVQAQISYKYTKQTVLSDGNVAGNSFVMVVEKAANPLYALRSMIYTNRNGTALLKTFNNIAEDLILASDGAIANLGMAPNAVNNVKYPLKGNEKAIGHDLLAVSQPQGFFNGSYFSYPSRRADTLQIISYRDVFFTGPRNLIQGYTAILVHLPIFFTDVDSTETFGQSYDLNNCPICYNLTIREKCWGTTTAIVYWDFLKNKLSKHIDIVRYLYRLYKIDPVTKKQSTIASSENLPKEEELITIPLVLFNDVWYLTIEPVVGWEVSWKDGATTVVVVFSFLMFLFLLFIMVSNEYRYLLLESILPPKVIKSMKNGERFVEDFECVTILFSDIVGYTKMSSELHPHQIVELLDELYKLFDDLAGVNNVYKVETIGDAFMCTAGCPDIEEPDVAADRVAKMGLAMIEAVKNFKSTSGISLEIRIGIHSGPVVASVIGTKMPRYCLFGDTVNTASRMESSSLPMQVHCSQATADLLSSSPLYLRTRGLIDIKGKGEMTTYWIESSDPKGESDAMEDGCV